MGILDEAIREHLELKRQHGAADTELQQLEDEAFGPPARPGDTAVAEAPAADEAPTTLQPAEPAAEAPEQPAETELPPEAEPPGEADEPLPEPAETSSVRAETEEHPPPEGAVEPQEPAATEPPAESPEPLPAEQSTELYEVDAEPAAADVAEDEFFSEQSLSDELDQALDAPDEGVPPEELPAEEPVSGEPPHEGAGESEQSAEPEQGEEDVLEETPEFLQDTPEHDRLWFEQRPPKDFDFDD